MRLRVLLILALLISTGCSNLPTPVPQASTRSYSGTASVGDFLDITIDTAALTITYANLSNGDAGVVPYTVNSDGTYALNDPAGNLVAAYEIPGYAMLVEAQKAGPDHATPALVTAVAKGQITLATFENHGYNYMQFRTSSGGIEAGSVIIDGTGHIAVSSYSPSGALNQGGSAFQNNTLDITQAQQDPSGTFLTLPDDNGGGADYVFGTGKGIFVVDNPNGTILGLAKAASKSFDPSFAGTYKAIFYQKTGATPQIGNVETGTPSLGKATLVIDALANVTVEDAQGNAVIQTTLTPVADTSYLYGSAGELSDPCNGLFTFRITTANSQQDVFVTFMDRAVLFASFTAPLPQQQGNPYDYLYGVGLK